MAKPTIAAQMISDRIRAEDGTCLPPSVVERVINHYKRISDERSSFVRAGSDTKRRYV